MIYQSNPQPAISCHSSATQTLSGLRNDGSDQHPFPWLALPFHPPCIGWGRLVIWQGVGPVPCKPAICSLKNRWQEDVYIDWFIFGPFSHLYLKRYRQAIYFDLKVNWLVRTSSSFSLLWNSIALGNPSRKIRLEENPGFFLGVKLMIQKKNSKDQKEWHTIQKTHCH